MLQSFQNSKPHSDPGLLITPQILQSFSNALENTSFSRFTKFFLRERGAVSSQVLPFSYIMFRTLYVLISVLWGVNKVTLNFVF